MPNLKENPSIPIVFVVNASYAIYCPVAIQSIKEHINEENIYFIYILSKGVSSEIKYRLEQLSTSNFIVECIDITDSLPELNFFTSRHLSSECYYRFLIPNLFYQYKKVLYLDVDLIVQTDIAKLFNIELGNNLIAACHDCLSQSWSRYVEETYSIDSLSYVNSGMYLFNIDLWRKENKVEQCWKKLNIYNDKLLMHDQDILNMVCQNRIYFLDSSWNCLLHIIRREETCFKIYQSYFSQCKNVPDMQILHYAGGKKPWKDEDTLAKNIWWEYAKKVPFYEDILYRYLLQSNKA